MLEIIMALSLATASPVFTSIVKDIDNVSYVVQDNDPDETGGEAGHIPPIDPGKNP